jgi:hypothetical protein
MADRPLSEDLKAAGLQLLKATDALGLQAQGAMWVYSHALNDWRYYLVTALVDTIGRRKTYRLLLNAFEYVSLPKEMTIEDVHLGSPHDQFFQVVSKIVKAPGQNFLQFENCQFNEVSFDGVIYRAVKEMPTERQVEQIEKRFQKRVKELIAKPNSPARQM